MLKSLQRPLRGLLALVFLLTAAPASRAAYDSHLYDSLLDKIYDQSSEGDASDIYRIIRKALNSHPNEGDELVDALIKKLKDNLDRLDKNVVERDLQRVKKKLRNWLRTHRKPSHGPISSPESPTNNP